MNAVYRNKVKRLTDSNIQRLVNLNSRLNKDQLSALCRKSPKGLKWSTETIRDALVFKMKMGTKAYSDFVKKIPIYPNARSLQRDVQHMDFECGILHDVLEAVKPDVQKMPPEHRRCVIGMDECAIEEAEVYDPGTKKMIGRATFGPHGGLAKKANTLVVGGTTRRYKFTGAYHFTSSLTEEERAKKEKNGNPVGEALKILVLALVLAVEGIGLFVDAIIHDMGPDNMALWRALGIECLSSLRTVHCSIPHPARPGDRLWFLPDTVHIFKNIATSLSSNTVFRLSDDIVAAEGLRCNEVKLEHLQQLLNFEGNFELKVAYQLKQDNLDCKKKFAKMRVSNPCAIFCRRTEAALRAKAALANDPSFDATIFFVWLVTTWFDLVSNRGGKLALRKSNPAVYEWALNHIKKTADVFKKMTIGGQWKPIQKGMLVACEALLEIQEFLLSRNLVQFVLLGRFTQDFVENLYSLMRARQAIPNALHFKLNLRVITLAQICLTATNTSYFRDTVEDVTLPTNFIAITKKLAAERKDEKSIQKLLEEATIDVPPVGEDELNEVDGWEWLVLYDMAGSVIRSIKKMKIKKCDGCIKSLLWNWEGHHPCAVIVLMREYKDGAMFAVNEACFKATLKAEITFRRLRETLKGVQHVDVVDFLVENSKYVWDEAGVPECHDISTTYLRRFYTMRFRAYGIHQRKMLRSKSKREYGSKSMAMHTTVY